MTTVHDIDSLLDEPAAADRSVAQFDHIAGRSGSRIVLFGAGQLGVKTLRVLRRTNVEVVAFADNNPQKWNRSIDGVDVLRPQEAAEKFGRSTAFVVTVLSPGNSYTQIEGQLAGLGCKIIVPWISLAWKYPDDMLPHYLFDLPQAILRQREEILKAFRLMADEESRRAFRANLLLRLRGHFRALKSNCPGEQYFPEKIVSLTTKEVFIDGGAYTGDTIAVFLKQCEFRFSAIVAYEPDSTNFQALRGYVSSLGKRYQDKVLCRHAALAKTKGKTCFDATGGTGSSANTAGSIEVDCVPLDKEIGSIEPTFIKLDVEGSELDALSGATRIIQTKAPLLGVCSYHRPDDLWRIPLHVATINPDYLLYLRQHEEDGFESVVYAVPPWRACLELNS